MPQIPQFTGKRELSVESPNVKVNASDFGVKGKVGAEGEALSKVGNTLMQIGEKFQEIKDENEFTSAQVTSAKRLNDVYLKAQNNPDIWNAGKTAEEDMTKIADESSAKIGNQLVKNKFMASFEMDKMSTSNKINTLLRTKQLDSVSASALEFLDSKEQSLYTALSGNEQEIIKAEMKSKIDEMVTLGAWEKEKAYKEWAKRESDMRTGQVDHDADIDLKGTLEELKKGEKGMYPDLTPDERSKRIDSVGMKIRRDQLINAFQDNRQKDQAEAGVLVSWAEGTLTEKQLKDGLANMEIRRPFAERMFKKLYDDPTVMTDLPTFVKIRNMQLSNASVGDINQAILDNGNKLSSTDKKQLIEKTFTETDKQQKEKIKYNSDALKIWSIRNLSTPKNDLSGDVVYEFYRRVNNEGAQGGRIDEIAQEVIKDKIKEASPSTALMADVPNFVAERNSIKRVYDKNSKLKGKAPTPRSSVVTGGNGIDFDDL